MPSRRAAIRWLFCAILAFLWARYLPWSAVRTGENDFIAFYAGGELAGTPHLYESEAAVKIQRRELGATAHQVSYVRLPAYAWLCRPLTWMPYHTAHAVWQAMQLSFLTVFLWTFRREEPALVWLAAVSLPLYTTILNGQDIALVTMAAAFSGRALARGNQRAAGLWLVAGLVKFHFFVFAPLALLAARRWRALAWASAGTAGVAALCFAVQGPRWVQDYITALRNPAVSPERYTLPNLHGAAKALGLAGWAEWVLLALGAALVLHALYRLRETPAPAFGIALVGGLLVSHHAYVQDLLLLLAVLCLVPQCRSWLLALNSPVPCYLLLVSGPVSAVPALSLTALPWLAARPASSTTPTSRPDISRSAPAETAALETRQETAAVPRPAE